MSTTRRYKSDWERQPWAKGWLERNDEAGTYKAKEARCKVCKIFLRAHLTDLKKHSNSKNHTDKMASINLPKKSTMLNYATKPITDQQKIADMKMSAFVAIHTAIRSIDHLNNITKDLGMGSILETMKLHRTKCSCIIKNVIAPAMLEDLVEAIGNHGYSLIVDESTDVSVNKCMCLCVRYFNREQGRIVTDFLGIFLVEEATAERLYESVKSYLKEINLPMKNMVAIGTDGANNLCGLKKSLYALLKKGIPHLQLMKCTCHSIHLCSSKASEELPSSLEYLIREVYNWFKQSPLRRAKYKRLFDAINSGVESNSYYQLVQLSQTRWLAFHDACKRILEQWLELKTHFGLVVQTEKCYAARMINSMLLDDTNRFYLVFLKHILARMQNLNLTFQSEKVDVGSAYDEMYTTYLSFASKVLKPQFLVNQGRVNLLDQVSGALDNELAFLPLESMDFGIELTTKLSRNNLSPEKILELKQRCFNFLKRLLIEMSKRLPANMEIFKKYKLFSPLRCLGPERATFGEILEVLRPFLDSNIDLTVYEEQWQGLTMTDWKDHCKNDVPKNIIDFWPIVYTYTDGAGRFTKRTLAEAVLRMLCTPTSNACVERVFSVMNLVKTRIRNKMGMTMLEALLRFKVHFNVTGSCCDKFEASEKMLRLFTAKNMYQSEEKGTGAEDAENDEIFDIMENFI